MPSTISTTTKTWAMAARLTGFGDRGDGSDLDDGEPDPDDDAR